MVIVSPMRRTLETAWELLKTYPDKENLKIIVNPYITEILLNTNDLQLDPITVEAEFTKKFNESFFLSFISLVGLQIDFSMVR